MPESLTVRDIAALLDVSTHTVERLLETGAIPSDIGDTGNRFAALASVLAWRDQRDAQQRTLGELTRDAQRSEGSAPRRPPNVFGDLNVDDVEANGGNPDHRTV